MQSRPKSAFTYPALVSQQLQKADIGEAGTATSDEFNDYFAFVQSYCFQVSKIIAGETRLTFVPYYATKYAYFAEEIAERRFYHNGHYYLLKLPDDLLEIDSLTFMSTALTADQYRLVDALGNANGYPYSQVNFDPDETPGWTTSFDDKITIVGWWGTHDNEGDTYSTVTTTAEALDTTETGIDLANGEGALFEVYQYIRIDDELMLVTAITEGEGAAADVLTVTRGVNGSTAAAHDDASTITRWSVVGDVQLLATRMVNYWYAKRNDAGERVQVIDNALIIAEFSKELKAIAERRRQNLIGVV